MSRVLYLDILRHENPYIVLIKVSRLFSLLQFLRKMAQPYDKAGGSGKKTLLSQEDLENMGERIVDEMLY